MRATWLVAATQLVFVSNVGAQQLPQSWQGTARNATFVEIGGSAGLYSLNLDRRLGSRWTFRGALAQYTSPSEQPQKDYMRLALLMNVLVGGPSDWLEVGVGPMGGRWSQTIVDNWFWSITSAIGYRHQTPKQGYVFRASVAPQFQFRSKRAGAATTVWPGLSFGISF
jgi:hypothetical protein